MIIATNKTLEDFNLHTCQAPKKCVCTISFTTQINDMKWVHYYTHFADGNNRHLETYALR